MNTLENSGGEEGIRTLDTGFGPYNGLANRRLQPLGHLTAHRQVYVTQTLTRKCSMVKERRRLAFKPSPLPLSATTRVGWLVLVLLVLGTLDWAHFRAHLARLLRDPFKKRKVTRKGDGFFDRRLLRACDRLVYSCRSAVSGSMRAARRAGRKDAS